MANISETELQRRLRDLEKGTSDSGSSTYVRDVDPYGTGYKAGDAWYNSATSNLWLFSTVWGLTFDKIHIRYADEVLNISTAGIASSQADITGFSEDPFTSGGVQKKWRGTLLGPVQASTDSTDYTWALTAGEDGYTPVKGTDYDDGISGNNIRVEYSTDGTTWVTTQVSGVVYLYIRTAQDTNNDGVYIAGLASKFVPEKGVEYDDGGTVAQLTIYKRSSTALSTPTGGQYNFGTHTLTAPTGWTSSIPTGTSPVYSSVTLANIIGNTGTDTTLTWSSPEITISDGAAGRSVYTTNVFLRQATAPGTPVTDTGSFAFGTNVLTVPTGSPSTEVWLKGMPSGTDPLYASEATFSVLGDTGTDSTVDWGTPRVVAQDGVTGLDGISTYLFSVFQRSATALTTAPTTGSYNFTTNTPTAPTGWYVEVPSGTDPLYVTTTLASTTGPTGSDSTLTWSTPVILAQDGYTPVQGVDYYDGTGIYISYIFITGTTAPTAPTTGSFDGTTETIPTGWQDDPYVTAGSITYVSKRTYTQTLVNGVASTTWTDTTWSTPSKFYEKGDDGSSYTGTTEYYKLTSSTTAPTIASGSWLTSPQFPTSSNQYLWNYNVNTRTIGNDINSPVSLVTQYVEDGVGISSIGEEYAQSSSGTSAPTSWGTYANALPLSDTSPYLWNKTTTTYTDSTTTSTSTIIAIKGIDADALTVSASTVGGVTTLTFSDGTTATVDDGATGTASGVKIIYASDASGTGASFTQGSLKYANYYEWTVTAPTSVPTGLTYTLFIGEDGDNAGVLPIYADDATGTGASLTDSTKDYVNFYEWTVAAPTTIPTGLTYVKFIGTDGVSYTGTAEYYKLTNTSTAPGRYSSGTVIDTGWSTTPSYPTSANNYLWNFNRNSKSNSTFDDSAVSLITQYVVDGAAGRGISGITEKYQLGTSASTAPTGTWQTTLSGAGSISASNPYLWNQTTIAYSDSSTSTVVVTLIAAKGDEGYTPVKGTDYNDGKGTYISYIFKTVTTGTTAPTAPTTGSYNGTTETVPTGWQGDPLITAGSVTYVSKRTYIQTLVNGVASTTWTPTPSTWSTPSNFYKEGYTPVKDTDYFDGTSSYLHIKYSDNGTSFTPNLGEDLGGWIGTLVDSTIADSTTFADYAWNKIVPSFERYYTTTAGLASEIGDPTTPGSGVTWTAATGAVPSTAYWIADRYTINSVTSDWQIYPVQAKDGGIPFVKYSLLSTTAPTLGDSVWITHAILAVEAWTGRDYTNQKEFGYGTVVVIDYNNSVTLSGRYVRLANGSDSWVAPGSFFDGDLIVDGTIAAAHIQAASIDSNKLVITGTNPVSGVLTPAYLGADSAGSAATAESNAVTTAGTNADTKVAVVTTNIYATGTTTIDGGKLAADTITAASIAANTITADQIAAGTITANEITVNDRIDFSEDSSGLAFSKTSLADSTVGGYYGRGQDRDGNSIVGMSISSADSSFTVDSSGTLAMVGVKLYTGTPGTPTAFTSVTTTATYPISASSPTINILLIGAGGGGAGNAQNAGAGSAGVSTIIKVRNSSNQVLYVRNGTDGSSASDVVTTATSGFTIQQFTAAGGAGGVNFGANNVGYTGGTGGSSSKGTGGYGSGANYNSPATPATGSGNGAGGGGAGSPYVQGTTAGYGGDAGTELTITGYVPPNGASNIIVTIGAGGAGGPQSTSSGGQVGAAGSTGYVSVADPTSGGDIVDLASISDKFTWPVNPTYSQTSTLSNQVNRSQTEVNLGSGGAGWYHIQNISGYGGKLQNVLTTTGAVNSPNIVLAYPVLFYCTGTPRLQSTEDGNTYYRICTVKWLKLS